MLSESWDEKCDEARMHNLQRDLARIMLSLARVPLPRIGAFRLDDAGYLRLDNRPLSTEHTVQANDGIPVSTSPQGPFARVGDFVLHLLEAFDNRLSIYPSLSSGNCRTTRDI